MNVEQMIENAKKRVDEIAKDLTEFYYDNKESIYYKWTKEDWIDCILGNKSLGCGDDLIKLGINTNNKDD
jgi:hypothetical protein